MPKLGNTVEQCLLVAWNKRKGDAVCAGDILAEMETDKATFDLTAPVDGTVLELFFDDGAMPVFTTCASSRGGEAIETIAQDAVPSATAGTAATTSSGNARKPRRSTGTSCHGGVTGTLTAGRLDERHPASDRARLRSSPATPVPASPCPSGA